MKKRIFILLAFIVIGLFCLTGCNYNMLDVNYNFTKAYVKIGEKWVVLDIAMWTDYEGEQIQITLKDGTVMVVSSVNCILYNGNLPKGE
jgi:hypothetical protein